MDDALREAAQAGQRIELLGLRDDFRLIVRKRPRIGLRYWIATRGESQAAAPVAVWLLGRCGGSLDTRLVGRMVGAPCPPSFARRLAKALFTADAWQGLAQLAARFPEEPVIQRLARGSRRMPFEARLARFSSRVDDARSANAPEHSRMPLWYSSEFWRVTPARSASAIRVVLERIHRLVRRAS